MGFVEARMTEEKAPPTGPTPEQLKHAFKAFKKRLKLTRLDDESKVTRRPVTGGKGSGIVAIAPPIEYPQEVWDALVKQGKLKHAGHGLYELAGE
jgi:hypothetical protein